MMKFSLLLVPCVMDSDRSTSPSFFSPSGVSSNAHAKNIAKGKPSIRKNADAELIQPGGSKAGPSVSPMCIKSQAMMM